MAWFKRKSDPISERARALSQEIAALEAQIKDLHERPQSPQPGQPRLRSTAVPQGSAPASAPAAQEPVFVEVDQERLQNHLQTGTSAEYYNELGVRKYDLPALLGRIRNHLRGPSTTNPKLVSYLAAGGIQGLRPLRYEKRVARNRFILLVVTLLAVLLGVVLVFWHR